MGSLNVGKLRPLLNKQWQGVLQKQVVTSIGKRLISKTTRLLSDKEPEADPNNPLRRTFKVIGKDLNFVTKFFKGLKPTNQDEAFNSEEQLELFQTHCDILVIGGGGIGSSIAYWLKKKARDGLNVVVVEKDPTYRKVSAIQPFHGLNPHFSTPENIQMAMYGADFIRESKDHLGDVNLNFTPYGSLKLATEEDAETLKKSSRTQNELGVRNELLSQERIKSKFPWLNTEGIVLGCHGLEREGWFDPIALLRGYKNKALDYGAHFVEGEVVDFEFQIQSDILVEGEKSNRYHSLEKVIVRMPDGELRSIKFAICIIAAGSGSGDVGRLARIGNGPGLLTIPLPVERKKRYSYIFSSQTHEGNTFSTPLTVDPNGTYFRREGLSGNYVCGRNSNTLSTPEQKNMETEQNIFDTEILPTLAHRVHAFKDAKVQKSWADQYEYNTFDENGIIGTHPYYNNLYMAVGFNQQGIQQTPAIGRGMSELIVDGRFRTIDLTRLGFDRIIVNQPLYEDNVI